MKTQKVVRLSPVAKTTSQILVHLKCSLFTFDLFPLTVQSNTVMNINFTKEKKNKLNLNLKIKDIINTNGEYRVKNFRGKNIIN